MSIFQVIVDPVDFQKFIKAFRSLQCKKEDNQIELRNVVLEWKSCLKNDQGTQEIRTQAYELIDAIESLHDEQDMLLEIENKKLEVMVRECAMDECESHRTSRDPGGVSVDKQGHESHDNAGLQGTTEDFGRIPVDKHESNNGGDSCGETGDFSGAAMDNQSNVSQSNASLQGTRGDSSTNVGHFTGIHKEISRRQQYLQMFNNQSTIALKRALLDIEVCRKMVDYSKDFIDDNSDEVSSCSESSEGPFPHPV